MTDRIRSHQRVPEAPVPGRRFTVTDLLSTPVRVYAPTESRVAQPALLVHFHGSAHVAEYAVHMSRADWVVASVHLGAGSAAYARPFGRPGMLDRLVDAVGRGLGCVPGNLTLSAFSAGYGAVRAVLEDDPDDVERLILLDGLHTGYVPEGSPLAAGGTLDTSSLEPFVRFARRAAADEKRFLLSHSAVFPGTFASTTECADYLLDQLGIRRRPLLQWGPGGMQQVSRAGHGGFEVMTYAGNTAPDHVDHLHALFHFLQRVCA